MRNAVGDISFLGSFQDVLPEHALPEIAFAGRSNVGKSSLLNVLMKRKNLARTSSTPGRTQAINLFQLGSACVFADLPGYGYARVPDAVRRSWGPMIEGYLGDRSTLALVVLLVDVRRDIRAEEGELRFNLTQARIPTLIVATKVDKLKKQPRQRQLAAIRRDLHLPTGQPIAFSSHTGEGRDRLWDAIEEAVRTFEAAPDPVPLPLPETAEDDAESAP
ncbi:MAG: ribosome biogenesis GTP-binding protein YihA/YsxC [Myxococcota bacterium]